MPIFDRFRNKQDVEFTGLADKVVEVEKELSLYTREGQFYVLLADSDSEERVEIERMIDQTGCFVTSVASGIECMDQVLKDKFDLILLARNMPRMDGIQTLHNIKDTKQSKCRDAKIYVILDEKADEPDIFFENAGFDGMLRKPIDRTIIQSIIINLVPPKMLPDDENLIKSIRGNAEDAATLKKCEVRLIEGLKNFDGQMDQYKAAASKFCEDYEVQSSVLMDYLYTGKSDEYMDAMRTLRESAREIGATYLSYCFDDHVNMAKDDSLDVAESNWRSLIVEWENVVSGLAEWLGKKDVQIGITEILTSETNGIRLTDKDIQERINDIITTLEENRLEESIRQTVKLSEYDLDPDVKLKVDRVIKAFNRDNINTAVDILKSI